MLVICGPVQSIRSARRWALKSDSTTFSVTDPLFLLFPCERAPYDVDDASFHSIGVRQLVNASFNAFINKGEVAGVKAYCQACKTSADASDHSIRHLSDKQTAIVEEQKSIVRCFLGTTNLEPLYAGCQLKDVDVILPIDPAALVKQLF